MLTKHREKWHQYKKQGDHTVRGELICEFVALVHYVFGRMSVYLPRILDDQDLIAAGMIGLISANVVNTIANRILIFGAFGIPPLGVAGAGWATGIASIYLVIFFWLSIVALERRQGTEPVGIRWAPDPTRLRQLLALGFPAALHITLEFGVFALVTGLAHALRLTGDHVGTLKCAAETMERFPEDGDAMYAAGLSFAALGQNGRAILYLERFLASKPEMEASLEARSMIEMLRKAGKDNKVDFD